MTPSRTQVAAAVETLLASGWQITPPASERLQLLTPRQVADLVGCGLPRAREIIMDLPGALRLPGGELRARIGDLEGWIAKHQIAVGRFSRMKRGAETKTNEHTERTTNG